MFVKTYGYVYFFEIFLTTHKTVDTLRFHVSKTYILLFDKYHFLTFKMEYLLFHRVMT